MQPFPHPSDAIHKVWSRLADSPQRYSSLKVWRTTDGRQRRTDDGPLVYYKLTLWAFGSGDLIKANPPGYLWSKYECFLMSGCWEIPHLRNFNVKLWSNSTNHKQMNEHTYGRTERRKLYTPQHKCRGYNELPVITLPLEWSDHSKYFGLVKFLFYGPSTHFR